MAQHPATQRLEPLVTISAEPGGSELNGFVPNSFLIHLPAYFLCSWPHSSQQRLLSILARSQPLHFGIFKEKVSLPWFRNPSSNEPVSITSALSSTPTHICVNITHPNLPHRYLCWHSSTFHTCTTWNTVSLTSARQLLHFPRNLLTSYIRSSWTGLPKLNLSPSFVT